MALKYYEDNIIDKNRKSIFLAGPTPRTKDIKSWRPLAIKILKKLKFDGDIYIPESKSGMYGKDLKLDFKYIFDWELEHLSRADAICFWIPRELNTMPAFTTNVEFGYHIKSRKIIYGRPENTPETRYLDCLYEKEYEQRPCKSLEETLKKCVNNLTNNSKKTFFTSDTHFSQIRTLKYFRPPFKNAQEMNQTIVCNWNKIVNKNDLIYHLGDFGDLKFVEKLNGNIILILGNYEIKDMKENFNNNFKEYKKYLISLGFKDVIKKGKIITLSNPKEKIYLTHRPTDCNETLFNLFGHIHNLCKVKKFGLNVGTDCFNYLPVSIEEVLFFKQAIEKYYDQDVFV